MMKMTKKLQELANEAWQYAQYKVPFMVDDSLIEHANRREVEMAKYAELIMAECAKACDTELCGTTCNPDELIKSHFEDVNG